MKLKCKISDAITLFGREVVEKVIYLCELNGISETYISLNDIGLYDEANCILFMYFENSVL